MANRGRSFVRRTRRATNWITGASDFTALGSVTLGAQLVAAVVTLTEGSTEVPTIIRIRGTIHLELAAETAADTLQEVGVGIALVDDRALAVSASAGVGLPQPIDDEDFEGWMWWRALYLGTSGLAFTANPESDGTGRRIAADIEVDSKAMRKWDENQTLVYIVQNKPIDGTATEVDVALHARVLIKHP